MNKPQKSFLAFVVLYFAFSFHVKCADYYWVGGTGNWSNYASHWAIASGSSVFHIQPPTPSDNVFFDANSFPVTGDTVYLDSTIINCATMDWSGVTNASVLQGSLICNNTLSVYGSLILNQNMKWNLNGYLNLNSTSAGNVINTNGVSLLDSLSTTVLNINGSGNWHLLNDLTVIYINIYNGTFYSDNHTINCDINCQSASGYVYLGTSTIYGALRGNAFVDADSTIIYGNVEGYNINFNVVYNGGYINADSCSFNYLECEQIDGANNFFKNVLFVNDSCGYYIYQACNYIRGKNNIFQKAVIPCSYIDITNSQTFDTLVFDNPGQIVQLHKDTITINSQFVFDGTCSGLSSLIAPLDTATISFVNGLFNFDFLYLQNIRKIGSANCTLNNSIDGGGNSGWIINSPTPRILYWVGGSGNWNDAAHWSNTSGGTGGACVPNQFDSLFFDVNSFPTSGDTVLVNADFSYCRYMDWSGATNAPVFRNDGSYDTQLNVFGSLILNPNMIWDYDGSIYLNSTSTGNIIKTIGINFNINLWIESGSWDLQSDFYGSIGFIDGTLNTNNFNMNGTFLTWYDLTNNVTVFFGTSTVSGNGFDFSNGNNTLHADSATFNFNYFFSSAGVSYDSVTCTTLSSNSCTFNNVQCQSISGNNNNFQSVLFNNINYCSIQGNNNHIHTAIVSSPQFYFGWLDTAAFTFDSLQFTAPVQNINFISGSVVTINNFLGLDGSCSGLTSLTCTSGSASINKNGNPFTADYLLLQNIHHNGNAIFTASNTIDNGGNNGWIINSPAPRNLFWVGGTGNCNDITHWSTTSGGTGGACVPNQYDDLFFDANSFPAIGDTVIAYFQNLNCHSMDWSGITNYPHFYFYGSALMCYGSFILSANMGLTFDAALHFMSNLSGNIINTNGQSLTSNNPWETTSFDGTGSWDLAGDFTADYIYFNNGTFRSNNYTITVGGINPVSHEISPTIDFGTSIIHVGGDLLFQGSNTTIHADSCTIYAGRFTTSAGTQSFNIVICDEIINTNSCTFKYAECNDVIGNNNSFSDIHFTNSCYIYGSNNIFHNVIVPFNGSSFTGSNSFDTLIFNNPGQTIDFNSGVTTVNNYLQIQSSPGFPTSIQCTYGSATITKPTDTVCTDYVYLSNLHATGGAVFYAGDNSVDLGNNSGWNFSSCTPVISNVWPGDANYDLIVDNFDLLNIGLAYNDTGSVRPAASLNYFAQPCTDWNYQFANGANVKHADTDGNGIADANDTLAVSLNYGLTHPFRLSTPDSINSFGTDLYFQMPGGVLNIGDTVDVPILFGTANNLANNAYGFAFTVNYDAPLVQQGTMSIDFNNSWIATSGNYIHLEKDFSAAGKIDMGFSRIDHADVSGYGVIATLHFVIAANSGEQQLMLSFSHIKVISHFETEIPVNPISNSGITGIADADFTTQFYIVPNPMLDRCRIVFNNPDNGAFLFRISDITGRLVQPEQMITGNEMWFERKKLSSGIYFVSICNEKNKVSVTQKLVIE